MKQIFEVGKPIPKIWLYRDFDFIDTLKYWANQTISNQKEKKRLENKYFEKCI